MRWKIALANVRAAFVKERRAVMRSPTFYVLGAVFLGLAGYFFYTDVVYFDLLNQDKTGLTPGLWQRLFEDLRLCLLVIAPVLAARSLAEERRLGTLEMLLSYPIGEGQLVAGKFLSLLALFFPVLAVSALFPAALSTVWTVDPWPLVAAYTGILLLTAAFLACGLFASSLASQQSTAALGAIGFLFLFWFLAWNEAAASAAVLEVQRRLSLFDRFHPFTRGTIHSADAIYLVVLTLLFLFFAVEGLRALRRTRPSRRLRRVLAALVLAVAVDELAVRNDRVWDLGDDPHSALAPETRVMLATLERPVRLTAFHESGRYAEVAWAVRKFAEGSPRVTVRLVDVDRDLSLARHYGVGAPNTVVAESDGRTETVPLDEGFVARAITAVTRPGERLVCLSSGHGEAELRGQRRDPLDDSEGLGGLLADMGWGWQEVVLAEEGAVPAACGIFFVHGPRFDFRDSEIGALEGFIGRGGRVLVAVDPIELPRIEAWLKGHRVVLGGAVRAVADRRLHLRDPETLPVVDRLPRGAGPGRFSGVLWDARRVDYARAAEGGSAGGSFLGHAVFGGRTISVGAALRTDGEGRLVVVGDSDFLRAPLFTRETNRSLFAAILAWTGAANGVPLGAVRAGHGYPPLTESDTRFLLWVAALPAILFLVAGGIVWRRGRAR